MNPAPSERPSSPAAGAAPRPRRLRVVHFSPWAGDLEDADAYLRRLPGLDLRGQVENPGDPELMRKARLDCDWYGENTRAFSALQHSSLEFLPARVTGVGGLLQLTQTPRAPGEETWLVFDGQNLQKVAPVADRLLPLLRRARVRLAWYAFDEASRTAPVFKTAAPHLDVLIHDEQPLDPAGASALRPDCVVRHRSWVANIVPFSLPFNEQPEERILFLGSQLGLTEHRRRQIAFLQETFRDRFVAIHDHSVPVLERGRLHRFKVSVCPEGRKFTTPAMSRSHTDRPFWSGCLGLVPVAENSAAGDRLDDLAAARLLERYPRGDVRGLQQACERALAATPEQRLRIYDHYNRHETVGTVLVEALQAAGAV